MNQDTNKVLIVKVGSSDALFELAVRAGIEKAGGAECQSVDLAVEVEKVLDDLEAGAVPVVVKPTT